MVVGKLELIFVFKAADRFEVMVRNET